MWDYQILELGDKTVLVDCGPMRMFVEAWRDGVLRTDACREAANAAIGFLAEVAQEHRSLKRPAMQMDEPRPGSIVHTMWQATRSIGDPDLTPMAAVAGTIAGATADFLRDRGLSRIMVNNGGDIALYVAPGETLNVGIRPDVRSPKVSHRAPVTPETQVRGIATSGIGGRSFTRGIASAATVLASCPAIADAAATALANATFVVSRAVIQVNAEELYPDTDLRGVKVTTTVGELTGDEITTALDQALTRARDLEGQGLIAGACLFVKGRMGVSEKLSKVLEVL